MGFWYWACGPESKFIASDEAHWVSPGLITKDKQPSGFYNKYSTCLQGTFFNRNLGADPPGSQHVKYPYNPQNAFYPGGGGNEGCLCMFYGNAGKWSDTPNDNYGTTEAYIIEYGDRLWGNSVPLKDSVIVSIDIGRAVTVKYHYNHPSNPNKVDTGTAYYNMAISEAMDSLPIPPNPTDYTFLGWFTAASGGTEVNTSSNVATLLGGSYKPELNLYAQWHINPDTTAPMVTLASLKYGNRTYTAGNWTGSDVTAEYDVSDLHVSMAETSGMDVKNYHISLDSGKTYFNADTAHPGVTVNTKTTSKFTITVSSEGEYNLRVKVADAKGNYTESGVTNLKIDKTKPVSPGEIDTSTQYYNTKKPEISGTGEPGCTIIITENGKKLIENTVSNNKNWELTLPSLPDGEHKISITQTDAAGNTSPPIEKTVIIDTKPPTGKITIKTNEFTEFLNKVTFGLFFKDHTEVEFEAEDESPSSGIKSIEYLKRDSEFNSKDDAINATGWTKINNNSSIKIDMNTKPEKFIIYAKITDNAGNTTCINSNGVTVYTDSTKDTVSINFTKTTKKDISATVNLNGNTIKSISNGGKISQKILITAKIMGKLYLKRHISTSCWPGITF